MLGSIKKATGTAILARQYLVVVSNTIIRRNHSLSLPKLMATRFSNHYHNTFMIATTTTTRLTTNAAALATKDEHVIVALGGNALLRRGQPLTVQNQRQNIQHGMESLKAILNAYRGVTLIHGNGPQSGLLVLESAAYEKETGLEQMPLDVIDAETEGMIGYAIEQELARHLAPGRGMATLLSQIVVDAKDPAFANPTKFIGPVMTEEEAKETGLPYKADGEHFRRVVPSPFPIKMLDAEMNALQLLTKAGCVVICAGGGGIPVVVQANGQIKGVEAVIDKDRAAAMVGEALQANGLIILSDVTGVAVNFRKPNEQWIRSVSPGALDKLMDQFPDGSMGPKCASAIDFVRSTGGWAAIGSLGEAKGILEGTNGTLIESRPDGRDFIEFYPGAAAVPNPLNSTLVQQQFQSRDGCIIYLD